MRREITGRVPAGFAGRILSLLIAGMMIAAPATLSAQSDSTRRDTASRPLIKEDVLQIRGGRVNGGAYAMPPGGPAGGGLMAAPPSVLGATVGGAQDIGYARQLIAQGKVPTFIDFPAEGLYSEHDIPTPETDCDDKLCLSLGYGFAPAADTRKPALFVHLGMASGVRPEEFRRPSLQLALVIDRSGSMSDAGMPALKQAIGSLLEKLTPEDILTIVTFNDSATLLLPPTPAREKEKILELVEGLQAQGGTNIEAGLQMGFDRLDGLTLPDGYQKRLMLFTDARPNAGRTDSGSFRALTERYAAKGIGLTAFGVGLDFGQEMMYHISKLRGGNFFFLETPEKIATVFETEFDYLVTPVVYDLDVTIRTPDGLKLTAVYGLPTWKPGDRDAGLHIPTVFFSSNRGAIVLRYEREDDAPLSFNKGDLLADGTLSYAEPDGSRTTNTAALRHKGKMRLSPGMQYYTHEGMRTAVALTNVYLGMRDGCLLYTQGKKEEAMEAIRTARTLVDLENLTLLNAGLGRETDLLEKLSKNIEESEPVADKYRGDPEKGRSADK